MNSLRMIFAGTAMLLSTEAFADLSAPPPPEFGDCVVAKQKKSPSDDCQECNGLLEDTCEKQWKSKGYTQSCKIKPQYASDWREVWCKSSTAELTKEPVKEPVAPSPARTATETTKEGGCAVDPAVGTPWAIALLSLGLLIRRKQK
jgi:hypothetical protein